MANEDLVEKLEEKIRRWKHLYEEGGSDPFWSDGVNLALVGNHIRYYKNLIEEKYDEKDYPKCYYWEVPVNFELDSDYMAKKDEILKNAEVLLKQWETNTDYIYLKERIKELSKEQREENFLDVTVNRVKYLRKDIQEKNYIDMRRAVRGFWEEEMFKEKADIAKNLENQNVQMCLI
jgi:hypothetical protein